jgi:hypothetical protein
MQRTEIPEVKILNSFHLATKRSGFIASTPNSEFAFFNPNKKQLIIRDPASIPNRKVISLNEILKNIPKYKMGSITFLPNGNFVLCYQNHLLIIDLEKITIVTDLKNIFPNLYPFSYSLTALSDEKIIAVPTSGNTFAFMVDIPKKSLEQWGNRDFFHNSSFEIQVACTLEEKTLIRCFRSRSGAAPFIDKWSPWAWMNIKDFSQLHTMLPPEDTWKNNYHNECYVVRRANRNYLVNIKKEDHSTKLNIYSPNDLSKPIESYDTKCGAPFLILMSSNGLCLFPDTNKMRIGVFSSLETFFIHQENAYLKTIEESTGLPTVLTKYIIKDYLSFFNKNNPVKSVDATPAPGHTP